VSAIQELSLDEIEQVDGAADSRMIATGLAVIAGGVLLSGFPPAAGAVMSLGVHIVAAGLVS
jgi:hypothetical protein